MPAPFWPFGAAEDVFRRLFDIMNLRDGTCDVNNYTLCENTRRSPYLISIHVRRRDTHLPLIDLFFVPISVLLKA